MDLISCPGKVTCLCRNDQALRLGFAERDRIEPRAGRVKTSTDGAFVMFGNAEIPSLPHASVDVFKRLVSALKAGKLSRFPSYSWVYLSMRYTQQ